ncbi:hypothetical protein [Erwinia sp. V71]|uniref:hypothetical protein n=1 Tax=Erwinia sp. V71 TaxID=3369424 RepID=UPI003F642216
MADVIAMAQGVKAAAAGISVWVPVISAGAGILGALGSQWLSHIFITRREKRASEEKLNRERYYIGTELVFLLERYSVAWMSLGSLRVQELSEMDKIPSLDLSQVKGDWRSLSSHLIFRIRAFETNMTVLSSRIQAGKFNDYLPVSLPLTYDCLKTGIQAFILAAKIRREAGLPDSVHLLSEQGILDTLRGLRKKYWKRIVLESKHGKETMQNFPQIPDGIKGGIQS